MTKKDKTSRGGPPEHSRRRVSVRSVRQEPADYRKVARALIALVEAEAAAEADATRRPPTPPPAPRSSGKDAA